MRPASERLTLPERRRPLEQALAARMRRPRSRSRGRRATRAGRGRGRARRLVASGGLAGSAVELAEDLRRDRPAQARSCRLDAASERERRDSPFFSSSRSRSSPVQRSDASLERSGSCPTRAIEPRCGSGGRPVPTSPGARLRVRDTPPARASRRLRSAAPRFARRALAAREHRVDSRDEALKPTRRDAEARDALFC